jgi:hypothetical protein
VLIGDKCGPEQGQGIHGNQLSLKAMTNEISPRTGNAEASTDKRLLIPTVPTAPSTASLLSCGIDSLLNTAFSLPIDPCEAVSKLVETYNNVRTGLFQRKILLFFAEADSVDNHLNADRIEWASRESKEELGRQIILMLERADDERKATIYGQLYCALIRRKLNKEQFGRLCSCVDRAFFDDLRHLSHFKEAILATHNLQPIAESLQTAGLLSLAGIDGGGAGNEAPGGNLYQLNLFGKLLLESMKLRQAKQCQAT